MGVDADVAVIIGVHHFALAVADAERSTAFYRDLGFEVVADRDASGGYVEEVTGVVGAVVRIVFLSGFGHGLELLEYLRPRGEPRARPLQDAGSAHVCLLTDDLDAVVERLREGGVRFRSAGPVAVTGGPNQGARAIYAQDPDGNAVEIVEPPQTQPNALKREAAVDPDDDVGDEARRRATEPEES